MSQNAVVATRTGSYESMQREACYSVLAIAFEGAPNQDGEEQLDSPVSAVEEVGSHGQRSDAAGQSRGIGEDVVGIGRGGRVS